MPDNHFIDTNILIGYTVNWDRQFNSIQEYTEKVTSGHNVNSSQRVTSEANSVIVDRRQLTKQAARLIFTKFSGSVPIADGDIIDFVRSELSSYANNSVDHILQYIKDEISIFKGLIESSNERVLQSTIDDIHSDFGEPISLIDDIRRGLHSEFPIHVHSWGAPSYESIYSEYGSLKSLLPDSTIDRNIICDAHHLTIQDDIRPLAFVTMDRKDILSNKAAIESLFSDLEILHPGDV